MQNFIKKSIGVYELTEKQRTLLQCWKQYSSRYLGQ